MRIVPLGRTWRLHVTRYRLSGDRAAAIGRARRRLGDPSQGCGYNAGGEELTMTANNDGPATRWPR